METRKEQKQVRNQSSPELTARCEAARCWVRRQIGVDRVVAGHQACALFKIAPSALGLDSTARGLHGPGKGPKTGSARLGAPGSAGEGWATAKKGLIGVDVVAS